MNSPPTPETNRLFQAGEDKLRERAKVIAELPKTADVKDEFRGKLKESEDGKFTVDLNSRADVLKFREMKRRHSRAAVELMRKESALIPRAKVRLANGEVREIDARDEHQARRREGIHAVPYWGRGKTYKAGEPAEPIASVCRVCGHNIYLGECTCSS